jgi:hypothetical protein
MTRSFIGVSRFRFQVSSRKPESLQHRGNSSKPRLKYNFSSMKRTRLILVLAVVALGLAWLGHPVCQPIPQEDLKYFKPVPIEQRRDRDLFLFHTFQRRDGQWCQCKSWVARQLFF